MIFGADQKVSETLAMGTPEWNAATALLSSNETRSHETGDSRPIQIFRQFSLVLKATV